METRGNATMRVEALENLCKRAQSLEGAWILWEGRKLVEHGENEGELIETRCYKCIRVGARGNALGFEKLREDLWKCLERLGY